MIDNFTELAKERYKKGFRSKLDRFEKEAIVKTLRECKFDIEEGSKWLGYTPKSLSLRMKELKISISTNGRRKEVKVKPLFCLNKYDRACLDDLMDTWQGGCSTMHDDCKACPKEREACRDITYKLINRIYDKTGK